MCDNLVMRVAAGYKVAIRYPILQMVVIGFSGSNSIVLNLYCFPIVETSDNTILTQAVS